MRNQSQGFPAFLKNFQAPYFKILLWKSVVDVQIRSTPNILLNVTRKGTKLLRFKKQTNVVPEKHFA